LSFLAVFGEAEGLRMSKREMTNAQIHAGHQISLITLRPYAVSHLGQGSIRTHIWISFPFFAN
jgi:hypothetical protein